MINQPKRKKWTDDEIEYLKENLGRLQLTSIARNLGRSYESVRVKMTRLGLSNTKSFTDGLTAHELAEILQVDRKIVKGWMDHHGLPFIRKTTRRKRRLYIIKPDDFWKWAKNHKDKVQLSKIPEQVILPEPDWVREERRKDKNQPKKRAYKSWTTQENKQLMTLRKIEKLTYKEIGNIMNRSPISVERQYKRIAKQNP